MTEQDINLALAKWAGTQTYHECQCADDCGRMIPNKLPAYTTDLNAVHALEEKLSPEQQDSYCDFILPYDEDRAGYDEGWNYLHATAIQRCEALMRTLGLLKD